MKLSELIAALEAVKREHGDGDVLLNTAGGTFDTVGGRVMPGRDGRVYVVTRGAFLPRPPRKRRKPVRA